MMVPLSSSTPGVFRGDASGDSYPVTMLWRAVLVAAVIMGVYARLAHLGREGFWVDEGWSLWFAVQGSWSDLLAENHPPLYYLLLRGVSGVLTGDASLRAIGAVASMGTIASVYAVVRTLGGSTAAACAASALIAVAAVDVEVARELRMYPWMTLCFALALLFAARVAKGSRRGDAVGFGLACLALMYLHGIGGVFVLGALASGLMVATERRTRWMLVVAFGVAGFVYLPWFVASTLHRLELMGSGLAWSHLASIGAVLQLPPQLLIDTAPPWVDPFGLVDSCTLAISSALCHGAGLTIGLARSRLPLIGVLVVVAGIAAIGLRGRSPKALRAMAAVAVAFAVPYLLLGALSMRVLPFWDVRYLAACVVPVAVLAGLVGVDSGLRTGRAATFSLVALCAFATLALPQQGTWEQWREAIQYLSRHHRPGEVVVLNAMGQGAEALVARYSDDPSLSKDLILLRAYVDDNYGPRRCVAPSGDCLDRLELPPDAPETAWIVRGAPLDLPRFRFSTHLLHWLDAHFEVISEQRFQSVEVTQVRIRRP